MQLLSEFMNYYWRLENLIYFMYDQAKIDRSSSFQVMTMTLLISKKTVVSRKTRVFRPCAYALTYLRARNGL